MKKAAFRFIEAIVLFFVLGYLSTFSISIFSKLIQTLPVKFITYKPEIFLDLIQTAIWSSVIIAALAITLEWNREKRKQSYVIYLIYLTAPFVASFILYLITSSKVSSYNPQQLEFMGNELSTEIIPMKLVFIGYIIFPIIHFTLNTIKGRINRSEQCR